MRFRSRREARLWLAAVVCLAAIYASAVVARPVSNLLRDANLLRLAVGLLFAIAAALVLWLLMRRRPGRWELAAIAAAAAAYLVLFLWVEIPEERVHLLEFGLFAALVFHALVERRSAAAPGGEALRRAARPALRAVLATGAAGWLDEGLQHLVPERYYDLRDVALNLVAGALAVGALLLIQAGRRRDAPARP